MRSHNLGESLNCAINGVLYALKTQRNIRIHFVIAILVVIIASLINISRIELLVLLLTIGLVITAEMLNTAIEEVVNLVTKEVHPLARIAKDVAAGAVLVTSGIAVCVGYLIFIDRLMDFEAPVLREHYSHRYLTLVAIILVIMISIAVKALSGRSQIVQGGMPSGHAAIAFSLATVILFLGDGFIVFIGYSLALLVAQSRVEGEIHSILETVLGALLGFLVTLLLFQIKG